MAAQAIILFAHGARSAIWAQPFQRLRDLVARQQPQTRVALAFLELMTPSLPEQVASFVAEGVTTISVVPVFFGQGGHIRNDLPLLIDGLRAQYPGLDLRVAKAVGENEQVLQAIASYCITVSA